MTCRPTPADMSAERRMCMPRKRIHSFKPNYCNLHGVNVTLFTETIS